MSEFYDPAVAIPTLVGSLLSCVSSGLIFVCYIFLPQIPHFRHILILNLAGADFFNSLNNSISGIRLFVDGKLSPGPLCTANGFLGQLTVQGTDFSILLIAVVTVITLRSKVPAISDVSWKSKIMVAICVWTVPLITSLTGVGLHAYKPVSGNWCWISSKKPVLRYTLAHGWRFAIIITTVSLYIYLSVYFRSQFRMVRNVSEPRSQSSLPVLPDSTQHIRSEESGRDTDSYPKGSKTVFPYPDPEEVYKETSHEPADDNDDDFDFNTGHKETVMQKGFSQNQAKAIPVSTSKALTMINSYTQCLSSASEISPPSCAHAASLEKKRHEIRKMLLLNGYPIAYVILWIPGIANRILELTGHESMALRILQSSTQYVGLANAITYGYNEGIKRQFGIWWNKTKYRQLGYGHAWPRSRA